MKRFFAFLGAFTLLCACFMMCFASLPGDAATINGYEAWFVYALPTITSSQQTRIFKATISASATFQLYNLTTQTVVQRMFCSAHNASGAGYNYDGIWIVPAQYSSSSKPYLQYIKYTDGSDISSLTYIELKDNYAIYCSYGNFDWSTISSGSVFSSIFRPYPNYQFQETTVVLGDYVASNAGTTWDTGIDCEIVCNNTSLSYDNDGIFDAAFRCTLQVPAMVTKDSTNYFFDGSLSNISLYNSSLQTTNTISLADIVLRTDYWEITFTSTYVTSTQNNSDWDWISSIIVAHYPETRISDPSYYTIIVNMRETTAADIIDALSDVSTGIQDLNDTMTEIKDYVPPAADNVSGDAGHNAAAADAASALIPEISGEIKDRYDEIKAEQARQFKELIASADVSTFANIFDRLFDNLWVEILIGSELLFGIVLWLVKWALD